MIATWKQFFNLVDEVRKAQKIYFASKSQFTLERAKRVEKELDDCIEHQKQKWASVAEQRHAAQGKLPLGGQ
jgi:hypothetical protein